MHAGIIMHIGLDWSWTWILRAIMGLKEEYRLQHCSMQSALQKNMCKMYNCVYQYVYVWYLVLRFRALVCRIDLGTMWSHQWAGRKKKAKVGFGASSEAGRRMVSPTNYARCASCVVTLYHTQMDQSITWLLAYITSTISTKARKWSKQTREGNQKWKAAYHTRRQEHNGATSVTSWWELV